MCVRAVFLALVIMMLAGCQTVSARYVQAVDSSENSVKFLYTQVVEEQSVRGVIECDLEGDELTNCRELEVEYR